MVTGAQIPIPADRRCGSRRRTGRSGFGDCNPFEGIRGHGGRCRTSPDRQGMRGRHSARRRGNSAPVRRPPRGSRCISRCAGFVFWIAGLPSKQPFQFGAGCALRRTRLHDILAGRAAELGVRLLWGTHVPDSSALSSCRWIVGADGINSRVRHAAGLDAASSESVRFGFRRHYRISPWTDFVEVHWGSRCQVYVTPVSRDEVGVALLCTRLPPSIGYGVARVSGIRAKTSGWPAVQHRARRRDGFAQTAAGIPRTHGFGGRCLGLGGCNYRRRAEPLVSSGGGALRGAGRWQPGALRRENTRGFRGVRRSSQACCWLWIVPPSLRRNAFRMMALDPQIFPKLLARCVAPVEPAIQT